VPSERCSRCYDEAFDRRFAERELADYRRHGPRRATRALAAALLADPASDGTEVTALDVGGGVGALHHLLLEGGVAHVTDVDASRPYLQVAEREAERRGLVGRVSFVPGDLVAIADQVPPADLVGLDRVACCYPDADALIRAAAAHTRRRLAIVVPRDGWPARVVIGSINVWQRILRLDFRMYAHPHAAFVAAAAADGLELERSESLGVWRLLVFRRTSAAEARPAVGASAGTP
jgi:magnesium-protoporphyrin O-methyltransferase